MSSPNDPQDPPEASHREMLSVLRRIGRQKLPDDLGESEDEAVALSQKSTMSAAMAANFLVELEKTKGRQGFTDFLSRFDRYREGEEDDLQYGMPQPKFHLKAHERIILEKHSVSGYATKHNGLTRRQSFALGAAILFGGATAQSNTKEGTRLHAISRTVAEVVPGCLLLYALSGAPTTAQHHKNEEAVTDFLIELGTTLQETSRELAQVGKVLPWRNI
jgi:hypothetical protein